MNSSGGGGRQVPLLVCQTDKLLWMVCGRGRQTITNPVGALSEGNGSYGGFARCSWILAPKVADLPVHHDSCQYAHDGKCDEPLGCEYGTDSSDCSKHGDSCQYANNGECDEPDLSDSLASFVCDAGTDWTDCLEEGDYCESKGDGVCDEPTSCTYGTDSSDCGTLSLSIFELDLR